MEKTSWFMVLLSEMVAYNVGLLIEFVLFLYLYNIKLGLQNLFFASILATWFILKAAVPIGVTTQFLWVRASHMWEFLILDTGADSV